MTKEEALAAIKLLSAMESWALSQQTQMPDYLHDELCVSMRVMERILLDEPQEKTPQEKYTYGTPLLDTFTKEKT
jgi:hypothetical protein